MRKSRGQGAIASVRKPRRPLQTTGSSARWKPHRRHQRLAQHTVHRPVHREARRHTLCQGPPPRPHPSSSAACLAGRPTPRTERIAPGTPTRSQRSSWQPGPNVVSDQWRTLRRSPRCHDPPRWPATSLRRPGVYLPNKACVSQSSAVAAPDQRCARPKRRGGRDRRTPMDRTGMRRRRDTLSASQGGSRPREEESWVGSVRVLSIGGPASNGSPKTGTSCTTEEEAARSACPMTSSRQIRSCNLSRELTSTHHHPKTPQPTSAKEQKGGLRGCHHTFSPIA
mmetsp:Transcript_40864/g.102128  ORF Transcript_40864/g.102128 Transcript_40864/m.102128 type:complete len:282 (-) Transcript_40864:682-1527(-)